MTTVLKAICGICGRPIHYSQDSPIPETIGWFHDDFMKNYGFFVRNRHKAEPRVEI